MSAKLIVINDCFETEKDRYVGIFQHKTIGELKKTFTHSPVSICVNGYKVDDNYTPKAGDTVTVVVEPQIHLRGGGDGRYAFDVVGCMFGLHR